MAVLLRMGDEKVLQKEKTSRVLFGKRVHNLTYITNPLAATSLSLRF